MKLIRTVVCTAIAAAGISAPALAALGGDASSVERDRAGLRGTLRVSASSAYTVHEISTSAGLVVQEYAAPDGKVFAVSWRGPGIPDLQQVLGDYYEQFAQARAATAPARPPPPGGAHRRGGGAVSRPHARLLRPRLGSCPAAAGFLR